MGDQHREVGEVLGDERVVDRDLLAIEPARVVPGQGSAPAGAGEGERDPGKGGIGRILVHDAEAITGREAGREARAKTGVELAATKLTVPMFEPFFSTSRVISPVAAIPGVAGGAGLTRCLNKRIIKKLNTKSRNGPANGGRAS
jgi:hypothetical protein